MSSITLKERLLLKLLAEYHTLLANQIALLENIGLRAAQKKVFALNNKGLLKIYHRPLNGKQGRPDKVYLLSQKGLNYLIENQLINKIYNVKNTATKLAGNLDHEILINWFRIHLMDIDKNYSDLKTEFISASSLFLPIRKDGYPIIADQIETTDSREYFIPDGVFSIAKQNKRLLFFLEVDRSTEAITSNNDSTVTIAKKIINYQLYFNNQQYRRYEKKWNCQLNGFRCLILTNTHARKTSITNYLNGIKDINFIWIADQDKMFKHGLGANIWITGGNNNKPLTSILGGSLALERTLPKP